MATPLLHVEGISKQFGAYEVFHDVTLTVHDGDRLGLVGPNGAGKSTLLAILAGQLEPDTGTIIRRRGLRIGYLPQLPDFAGALTVRQAAEQAVAAVQELHDELEAVAAALATAHDEAYTELAMRFDELSRRFEAAGGFELERQIQEVLANLGFPQAMWETPVDHLSGGQRTRLALACALLAAPDLLLLDEPTNHLDLAMLTWLDRFLAQWPGAFVLVSHDRYTLDRVTTETLALEQGTITRYPGNYSQYVVLRAERIKQQQAAYEAQQAEIAKLEAFIQRYRAGQRAREARGRAKRLARIERIAPPREAPRLRLQLEEQYRSGQIVLESSPLTIGYSSTGEPRVLLRTPPLVVQRGERIALLGPNGSGKTSLLRTLVGEIRPLEGELRFGYHVAPAYFAQQWILDNPAETVLDLLCRRLTLPPDEARALAADFLFRGDDVFKPVGVLSGGERSRLALALLVETRANVLLLDEPTNHLDLPSREALETVLDDFPGTLLFASHDRYLIDRIATKLWLIENGTLRIVLGNYSTLLEQGALSLTPAPAGLPRTVASTAASTSRASARPPTPSTRSPRERARALRNAEERILALEAQLEHLADALAEASARQNVEELQELQRAYERTETALHDAYAHWEALLEEDEGQDSAR